MTWSGCACSWTGSGTTAPDDDTARHADAATPPGPGRPSSKRSSARRWTWSRVRAGWRRSCAAGSSAPGWPARACRWTSATPRPSPPGIRNAVILRDKHCQWAGRLQPARQRLPGPPRQAQGQRRQDQRQGLRAPLLLPPSGCYSPVGLDPGPESRRDHHRVEPGQNQGPAQPRTSGPPGVTPRGPQTAATTRRDKPKYEHRMTPGSGPRAAASSGADRSTGHFCVRGGIRPPDNRRPGGWSSQGETGVPPEEVGEPGEQER